MRVLTCSLAILALSATGCRPPADTKTPQTVAQPPAPQVWDVRVFATASKTQMSFDAMLDELAQQQFVMVGETHLDAETHRIEREILEGLIDRRPGKVSLSLEMFERDVQPVIDEYLAGKRDEASFLADARPWNNYATGYRPMVEVAKAAKIPVVGANFPRPLRMNFAMKKGAALDELSPQEKSWVPAEILPAPAAYWERLSKQLRDHGHGGMPTSEEDRLFSVQNLWDNSMADAAIAARTEDGLVMHVAGAFHVEYGLGTTAQIRARQPQATLGTVTIVPVGDLSNIEPAELDDRADYVVYVVSIARGRNDGTFAVTVTDEMKYLVAGDEPGATGKPMLLWLAEDGVRIEDELSYWKHALGPEVVVAVIVPPYRQEEDDLRVAGRWYWPDTYGGDMGRVVAGSSKIIDYATQHFGVDPRRTVVAGAGAGATAALYFGLYAGSDSEMGPGIVAAAPTDLTRFAEASLPRKAPDVAWVSIIAPEEARAGAETTLSEAGVSSLRSVDPGASTEDTWRRAEERIRTGLGLSPAPVANGEPIEVKYAADTPLARQWARLYARSEASTPLVSRFGPRAKGRTMKMSPERFADGTHLPLSPGAFGGTTILVLPKGLSGADRAGWTRLGEDDVLQKRSRFHHLAVTDAAGLPKLLADIHAKGRRNVLIVPAEFVASGDRMQGLRSAIEGHDPSLDIHWLPGLGSAYVAASRESSSP